MTARAFAGPTRSRALARSRTFETSILNHLTQRDADICLNIYEHRFLTTFQIFQLYFKTLVRTRNRLHDLYTFGVLNRFRPPRRPGSMPWHWVLDRLGAEVVAGLVDIEIDPSYFDRNRPLRLAKSPRLRHMRDVNEFFCRLIYVIRQKKGYEVSRWWGEAKSTAYCSGIVRPDAIGTLRGPKSACEFFLEMDRGTEVGRRLREKIIFYEEATVSRRLPRIVLFCFENERRESFARETLETVRLTVATSTLERHLGDPLGRNWLPVRHERRVDLLDLSLPEQKP